MNSFSLSFRVALRLLMLQDAALREAMARPISPADQLKIEQILAGGDPEAIGALPLQYCRHAGRRIAVPMAGRSGLGCRGPCPGQLVV